MGSGIAFNTPLKVALFDYDNQIMNLDTSTQFIITSTNTTIGSIGGTNTDVLEKGIATFDNINAVADPGSESVIYSISSKTLNQQKLQEVFGKTNTDTNIIMNFRHCQPGE